MSVIGFLGCGQMGQALLRGLLASGTAPSDVRVVDPMSASGLADTLGVVPCELPQLLADSDTVILAIKPHQIAPLCGLLPWRAEHLVISLAAGVNRAALQAACGPARVVRTMPNVAAQVGQGVTLVHAHADSAAGDLNRVEAIFGAVGLVERLSNEAWFHPATAVSGSGPAYFFLAMEALADGAVAAGLPRGLALRLAATTVHGAGALAVADQAHPGVLKDRVTSPGGTTIQAVRALEAGGFRSTLIEAVLAATARSKQMESE
jgi:pyrroline-5-carboxylate reductase